MADRASVSDWERPVVVGETTGPAVRGRPRHGEPTQGENGAPSFNPQPYIEEIRRRPVAQGGEFATRPRWA